MPLLLEVTKIQILKVIHNCMLYQENPLHVVGSHKDTNFESNSQQTVVVAGYFPSCWKSQRYKF